MSHVVVLGAGLGGVLMAYEMKAKLGPSDKLTVVNLGPVYSFVPSNPWVAVGWRKREGNQRRAGARFCQTRNRAPPGRG
jgi:sulfide:quinone oxidoreductase